MRDIRYQKLAELMVRYSTGVNPGNLVQIVGTATAKPMITEVYRSVLKAGGHPAILMTPDECHEIKLKEGSDDQIKFENPLDTYAISNIDVLLSFWGDANTKALTNFAPLKQALLNQGRKKFLTTYMERKAAGTLRWVGAQFPCQSAAQDAEMSLSEYEDFVFNACKLNLDDPIAAWKGVRERQKRMADSLDKIKELHFTTPQGTDLKLSVAGRKWINCDGGSNLPDGEVFSSPREDSTEGVVFYSFPGVYRCNEVDGIRLEFKAGKVVNATANKNESFLNAMLDQDDGARILGEIAFGTNYSITRFTKNTLFDEKIGGTFHAAVGSAFPESGGTNKSGLHWDMVCDLRNGGKVFADGKLISENGIFVDKSWPQPI